MKLDFKEYHKINTSLITILNGITEDSVIIDWAKKTVMKLISKANEQEIRDILVHDNFTDTFKIELEDTIHYLENLDNNEKIKQLRGNYEQVSANAKKWMQALQKKGAELVDKPEEGLKIVYKFRDGFTMVQLTNKEQCKREGTLMGHCVGGYDPDEDFLVSLRDRDNNPHVTLEISHDNEVKQIKGKQNRAPIAKYIPYVKEYLAKNPDLVIVGDGENIGYVRYANKFYDPNSKQWQELYDNTITPNQNKKLQSIAALIKEV